MWGISWANAQILLGDSIRVDYDCDKNKHQSPLKKNIDKIDLNDPNAFAILERMAGAGRNR